MPTVRSSFTPNGQNFEILQIDFRDVITSVLYTLFIEYFKRPFHKYVHSIVTDLAPFPLYAFVRNHHPHLEILTCVNLTIRVRVRVRVRVKVIKGD